jgi:hypothetical protein
MDLRNMTAMMEALCQVEGIDVSSITGDEVDQSLSPSSSTQYSTSETSTESDVISDMIEN